MPVNTASSDRRKLRFENVNAALREVDRIVAAEEAGKLRRAGAWTTGQTFGHVAAWINYAYEGYPFKVPWFIRLIVKQMVKRYIRDGMPAGRRIPRTADGTYGTAIMETAEGARRLREALRRLETAPAKFESPAFGALSEHDRIQLNLRHAELHLGFLHPQE